MGPNRYEHAPRLPTEGPIDPRSLFTPSGMSIELEVGPGRGGFIFERLEVAPEMRILGLEIRRKSAALLDEKVRARGLAHRARIFAEDVRSVLPRFSSGSLSAIYVHFPDPWWKKRHEKRRIITEPLITEVARVLSPGGELYIQTDVPEQAGHYELLIGQNPELEPWGPLPRVLENPYGARSPRERRALSDGLPIVRLRFRRRSS